MPILWRQSTIQKETRSNSASERKVNAKITIPLSKEDSINTIKALADETTDNERVKVKLITTKEGLVIDVDANDIIGLKAGVNTYLKLLSVNEEVKTCLKKKPEIK